MPRLRGLLAATVATAAAVALNAAVLALPAVAPPHEGLWSPLLNATAPGLTNALAYDASHRQLLAIEGVCTGNHVCQDPIYLSTDNATTWRLISAGAGAGSVEPFAPSEVETLVDAPALGGVVHICCGGGLNVSDMQVWNGSAWSPLGTTGYPGFCGAYGYDPVRARIVNFCAGATYTFDGAVWTRQQPVHTPAGGPISEQMAYDPATHSLLMVVDAHNTLQSSSESTWLWNGADWRLANSGSFSAAGDGVCASLGPASHAGMATDARDGAVVFIMDCEALTEAPASWAWNGHSWARQFLPVGDASVSLATGVNTVGPTGEGFLAYDTALGAVVDDNGSEGDWWRWTGLT
jgi:hypothetical protein